MGQALPGAAGDVDGGLADEVSEWEPHPDSSMANGAAHPNTAREKRGEFTPATLHGRDVGIGTRRIVVYANPVGAASVSGIMAMTGHECACRRVAPTMLELIPHTHHWHLHGHWHWPLSDHLHWNSHHRHAEGHSQSAGACVGRVGTLATVLGIGIAVATGFCAACATAAADTGERNSPSGGSNSSTSQAVESGTRRNARSGALSGSIGGPGSVGAGQAADAAQSSAPPRAATTRSIQEELLAADGPDYQNAPPIHFEMPEPVMSPTSPEPPAPPVDADPGSNVLIATGVLPGRAVPPAPLPVTALSMPSQTPRPVVRLSPQPTIIVAPPAVDGSLATTLRNIVSALSEAWPGGTPAVPADASLAMMLGTGPRAAARPATATKAVAAASTTTGVEAEKMKIAGAGRSVTDRNASGGYAIVFSGAGQATAAVNLPAASALTLRLRSAAGAPNMTLSIDGVPYTTLLVEARSYTDYTFAGGISAGVHTVSISSTTATTRDMLYIDKVTVSSGPIVEEFTGKSGSALSRLWTVRSGTGFDAGSQTYAAGNAFLDGQGHLVIQATRGKTGAYTSGWVWTKNNLSMGYGTVTVRAKMPKGQGLWPAVWMMGANSDTVGWPASGEIDIAELPSTTTTVYSTLHGPIAGTTENQQAQIVANLPDLSTAYHNYWVRHLENSITFGVDGRTLGTLTPADLGPGETWVFNRPMYLILNLAVGGPWAGAPNSSTPTAAKMLVESVTFVPA